MQTKSDVLRYCTLDNAFSMFSWPPLSTLRRKRVIVCTCIAAGFLLRYTETLFARPLPISHVLIDEAGQSPLPEALLPLCLMEPTTGSSFLAGTPPSSLLMQRLPKCAHMTHAADTNAGCRYIMACGISYTNFT